MKNPRETALKGLIALRRNGTWTDLFLKQEGEGMSSADLKLCAEILYGTVENMSLIDYYIGCFSRVKTKKMVPQLLDALRMTVYQIVFLDRIPDSAAINEGVKLVKKYASYNLSGFANGVLRSISREKDSLPPVPKDNFAEYLSVRYSHPLWFAEEMTGEIGAEETEKLFEADNAKPAVTARVNDIKISADELIGVLKEEGIEAQKAEELSNCIVFKSGTGVASSKAFKEGLFYIQDMASQLAVMALNPQKGDMLIDMCASPGGKTLAAAQMMQNEGSITACDIHPHKIQLIRENAEKYGANIVKAVLRDGTKENKEFLKTADRVICDVPCSGMGIIRKKPDIRFKKKEDIEELPNIQYKILENAASYLKKGGRLLYSTCTVRSAENEKVFKRFLENYSEYEAVPFELPYSISAPKGFVTLYPHRDGFDGFFISLMERKI